MLSMMCSLLRLVSKNITFAFFFASLNQRLSEMWEKKCDFTVTINKPISSFPTGKGYGLHTKRKGKVLSKFETMLVKNMAVVPHFPCLLNVACVLDAFATTRELLPECP